VEISAIESSVDDLNQLEDTMKIVNQAIQEQPWRKEKEKLIVRYRQLNAGPNPPSWDTYQREADNTVKKIGEMVLELVGAPFENFLKDKSFVKNLPELSEELTQLPDIVSDWTEENRGRRWYLTLSAKEATVQLLTADLERQVRNISREIKNAQPMIDSKKAILTNQIAQLVNQIAEEEQKLPEKMDAEMKKILPNWIGGIITGNQMMLYPFIIVGIVIYTIFIAFELTRHYQYMIAGLKVSDEVGSDGALSSLWTLNYRGRTATIITISIYVGFILVMWRFYEHGYIVFNEWQETETDRLFSDVGNSIVLWLGRFVFLFAALLVIRKPFESSKLPPQ